MGKEQEEDLLLEGRGGGKRQKGLFKSMERYGGFFCNRGAGEPQKEFITNCRHGVSC